MSGGERVAQIGHQLAPLVADQFRVEEVVAFEEQPDAVAREPFVGHLAKGGGVGRAEQPGEGLGGGVHPFIVLAASAAARGPVGAAPFGRFVLACGSVPNTGRARAVCCPAVAIRATRGPLWRVLMSVR